MTKLKVHVSKALAHQIEDCGRVMAGKCKIEGLELTLLQRKIPQFWEQLTRAQAGEALTPHHDVPSLCRYPMPSMQLFQGIRSPVYQLQLI